MVEYKIAKYINRHHIYYRSEPVPIQPVDHGKYMIRPSPPRTKPPDHSESDSNSGGEIDMMSDPNDTSFIRSDSILQVIFPFAHTRLNIGNVLTSPS